MKLKETKIAAILAVVFVLVVVSRSACAADLIVPHTFSPGTTAKSSEVNDNFETIYSEVNALKKQISSLSTGCADNTREGLTDFVKYPNIAACSGVWSGDIANGATLCGIGWKVCDGNQDALNNLSYAEASAVLGCFAYNAAQDNNNCYSGCAVAVQNGIDTATGIDMGGIGVGCAWKFEGGKMSCIKNGRIDSSCNSGGGCNYNSQMHTGVVCCKM